MDGRGRWIEDDAGMENITNQYFQNLFQTSNPNMDSIEFILVAIPIGIMDEQNKVLLKDFTREKIYMVIKNMHPSKAQDQMGSRQLFIKNIGISLERRFVIFAQMS